MPTSLVVLLVILRSTAVRRVPAARTARGLPSQDKRRPWRTPSRILVEESGSLEFRPSFCGPQLAVSPKCEELKQFTGRPVPGRCGSIVETRSTLVKRQARDEDDLRPSIDDIPQQVFVFGPDWRPLYANRRELEYTGLTPQESRSKDAVARIFHPEDLKKLELLRERARADRAPFEMEARIRGKDGQYRWFLIRDNPLLDEQGRVLRWYGTRTDIVGRKHAEKEMRKLASLVENSTDFIGFASLEGDVLFVNAAGQGMVGLAGNEQVRETKILDYIPEQNLQKYQNEVLPSVFRDGRWGG